MPVNRSPAMAALLSFLFPGVGQMYAGARRRGLLLATPVVALIVMVLFLLSSGPRRLLDLFLSSQALIAVLVLIAAFFLYHAASILDAYRIARAGQAASRRPERGSSALVAVLLAIVVALYGIPEYLGVRALVVGDHVIRPPGSVIPSPSFGALPTPAASPSPSPGPTLGPGMSPGPSEPAPTGQSGSPGPTLPPVAGCPQINAGWANDGRLNLLLLGADEGPGRFSLRTDTIILLSVDLRTCRAALFGFPRNMTMVPLPAEAAAAYPGGRFPEFLFALWRRAIEQPQNFPGDDETRGWRAVGGAVQELSSVAIDGMVGVNLNGFVGVVDALGGLWVDVPRRLRDDSYPREDGSGRIVLDIKRGCQRLEGWRALAYARSRHQDDDYRRMRRQQLVLTAFRRQFDPLALLPRVNELLNIAESNLWLFINRDDLGDMARLAAAVDPDRVRTITFAPPRYTSPLDDATIDRIRSVVRTVFDRAEPEPTPTPSGSPGRSCPP